MHHEQSSAQHTLILHQGEAVIDLGCGAGFDVFQAARTVGTEGAGYWSRFKFRFAGEGAEEC